jgi:predicted nucleic acid-binding protein
MHKAKLYLDTSVLSAYLDDRAPDRQRLTQQFWTERVADFQVFLSPLVLSEIAGTSDGARRDQLSDLANEFEVLPLTVEAITLADAYLAQGVFPAHYRSDALHVAVAVVHGCSYLGSWNFKHLVRVRTRREVNLINALRGYQPIEIVAPPEL